MIEYFKRSIQDKSLKKISGPEIGSWINIVNPSEKEIDYLVKKLKLDKRNLESGLDQNEIPRLEFEGKDIYVFTKMVSKERKETQTYLIIIKPQLIITFSKQEPLFLKKILGERTRFITTQKLKCLIGLFSLINSDFESVTVHIAKIIQRKKRLNNELKEKELDNLLDQEDFLNNLVFSYRYMNSLYEKISRRVEFFEQDKEIIEDLIIETTQSFELCKSCLKSISNIRSYYVVLLSNKLNKIITLLTIFTIVISLPAAISGIYGMNIALPYQENPFAFYYIVAFVSVSWLLFIFYLKRNRIV